MANGSNSRMRIENTIKTAAFNWADIFFVARVFVYKVERVNFPWFSCPHVGQSSLRDEHITWHGQVARPHSATAAPLGGPGSHPDFVDCNTNDMSSKCVSRFNLVCWQCGLFCNNLFLSIPDKKGISFLFCMCRQWNAMR